MPSTDRASRASGAGSVRGRGAGAFAGGRRLPSLPRLEAVADLRLLDGVRARQALLAPGDGDEPLVVLVQQVDLVLGQILDADEAVAGALQGGDDLVELQVDGLRVL